MNITNQLIIYHVVFLHTARFLEEICKECQKKEEDDYKDMECQENKEMECQESEEICEPSSDTPVQMN